eukprot:TRINITY_DN27739_c0_g4_i1.p1 TRINITY_DN27739_c0_g4~~TRINITY_DN27739_c0_g4_i1.p1  ORF type:complete len:406 (+),score=56.82 TRINITY_DN27739_c0_g4_i1:77-1294(+)
MERLSASPVQDCAAPYGWTRAPPPSLPFLRSHVGRHGCDVQRGRRQVIHSSPQAGVARSHAGVVGGGGSCSSSARAAGFSTPLRGAGQRQPSGAPSSAAFAESTPRRLLSTSPVAADGRNKVWFHSPLNSAHPVTPYAEIYGVHPRFFNFDAHGQMVPSWMETPSVESSPVDAKQAAELPGDLVANGVTCEPASSVAIQLMPQLVSASGPVAARSASATPGRRILRGDLWQEVEAPQCSLVAPSRPLAQQGYGEQASHRSPSQGGASAPSRPKTAPADVAVSRKPSKASLAPSSAASSAESTAAGSSRGVSPSSSSSSTSLGVASARPRGVIQRPVPIGHAMPAAAAWTNTAPGPAARVAVPNMRPVMIGLPSPTYQVPVLSQQAAVFPSHTAVVAVHRAHLPPS